MSGGLVTTDLTVAFGDVVAVDAVSLAIPGVGCNGLIGPNGSGKTTFLNAVSGFVRASGSVTVDGRPVALGRPRAAVACGLSRTFQTPQTFANLTCRENVLLGMSQEGRTGLTVTWVLRPVLARAEQARRERAAALLELVNLAGRADDLAGALSYGEQRRLEIARALATGPKMVLLDEPAAGLNQRETEQLADLIEQIRDGGVAFFLIEHKLDFVTRLCDQVSVLALGRVIAGGPPDEVLRDRQVMDAYLGMRSRA
ncbi:MAG TPA: ABC transporter ATP-binding protein [Acidimicrobiales bacterium]|nr:ABC transporter ATP-binding protein [Acidimicrobiales bacterium]